MKTENQGTRDWQCPTFGHRMTKGESKGYIACPTGVHPVQHVQVLSDELENRVLLLQLRCASFPASTLKNFIVVELEKLRDEIEVTNDARNLHTH